MTLACAGGCLVVLSVAHPAAALTIDPTFDASVSVPAEDAIETAIATIDSLYANPGTVTVYFDESSNSSFLGESEYEYYLDPYANYVSQIDAQATAHPSNTVLATAVANLAAGNKPGVGGSVLVTSAYARLALGVYAAPGVQVGATDYDGEITLSDYGNDLNFLTTPVSGEYSAIATVEHELNEVLGGGGAGSALNFIANEDAIANHTFDNDIGVLDPYRYSAPGVKSFTESSSANSYFSINAGVTDIIGFNQSGSGDYGDFSTTNNIQSAFTSSGLAPAYNRSSPEFTMMEAIGYDGTVPEPATLTVLGGAVAALGWIRRRARRRAKRGQAG